MAYYDRIVNENPNCNITLQVGAAVLAAADGVVLENAIPISTSF
jgi:hypothetical protein